MKMILTAKETVALLAEHGFRTSTATLIDEIENGTLPFGSIMKVGATGRRTTRIYRKDVEQFINERT